MILNDFERCNSPYFAFFLPNSTDFEADYMTVVEDRPIMAVKYCLPVPVFYTLNHKKRDILFLTITLANLSRFL